MDQVQKRREDGSRGQSDRSCSPGAGGYQGSDCRTEHRGDAKSARDSSTCIAVTIAQPHAFAQLQVCCRESKATLNEPGKNTESEVRDNVVSHCSDL